MNDSTDKPRDPPVLAASLFAVFLIAKIVILWGRPLPLSPWAPLAFLWQDAAVALAFLLLELVVRRKLPLRITYGAIVLLVAANVPVARVLSTPLTAALLRAARGTLSDSIFHHATPVNLVLTALVLIAGSAFPLLLRARGTGREWVVAAVLIALAGPLVARRIDTAGLERNALVALVRSTMPRVRAEAREDDWRTSPFGTAASEDLTRLSGSAEGRNVLLVVLESTAARYLASWGAAEDPTPNLSRLARSSIVFESAYAVYPESIKGLVAILAARYPGFDLSAERHASIASPSLATELRAAGYETAIFHSGRFFYLGMEQVVGGSGFARAEDAGDISGNRNSSFGVDEAAAVRHILEWIDSVPKGKQFFTTYLPIAGHHPYAYALPGPFPATAEIDRYRNALHEGDAALGQLLEGLRARQQDKNTIIVVIGDHGEAFGQHPGNYGHNLAIYDENVRVPMLIALPGVDTGLRVRRTASLLDVAPTILDLLGGVSPAEFQGTSLLQPSARMALFFTDYSLGLLGLRDGCIKYIHQLESDRSRMFDVCRDAEELSDIADKDPARAARYRSILRQWSAAQVARITGNP